MAEKALKTSQFAWEGTNRQGSKIKGEMSGANPALIKAQLRKQGINPLKVRKKTASMFSQGKKIKPLDIALFTRQMATMMKAGVPLLQSFDIIGEGFDNPNMRKLVDDLKQEVAAGNSFATALRKQPRYFDDLYCNLVDSGEQAGALETLLDRVATYKEKTEALKAKIKKAMTYPISVMVVAVVVTTILLIKVVPAFKEVFKSFGADLPAPTLMVIAMSDFFIEYWWAIFGGLGASIFAFFYTLKRSETMQIAFDRLFLRLPIFGSIIRKSVIARWTRTLSTMFSAGVPLVESLDSVGGAAGNYVYKVGTRQIQSEVSTGTSLTSAMQNSELFPNMVNQMVAIGEESGALDSMLGKVADFFEAEVDDAVEALSSLMEPIIMVVLGVLIGGMVIAMYLPIFKLGAVVG